MTLHARYSREGLAEGAVAEIQAGCMRTGVGAHPIAATTAALRKEIDATRMIIALILFGSAIRLVLAGAIGLGSDESYTVASARHLALSYVDYPPLHAWLVGIWSQLVGSEIPIIARLPFIALFGASTWMMFRLASFLFGVQEGLWAALLFNLAPVFTVPHASWVLPDGPLIFFLLSGAYVVSRLIFTASRPSTSSPGWMLAGALAGLAMLSKYHGIFLPAAVFLFLLSYTSGRRLLASPAPWLAAFVAVAVFTPVIIWNADHNWVGLFFETKRLSNDTGLNIGHVMSSILAQAMYLSPWLFIPLAFVWVAALWRGSRSPREWFLALLSSGPIIGFTLANLTAPGLPHWTMPGWLFTFPLLGTKAAHAAKRRPRLMRWSTAAASAALLLAFGGLAINARNGWLAKDVPQIGHDDPTLDLLSWEPVASAISERRLLAGRTRAVAAVRWMDAGKLNYVLGQSVPVLCLCSNQHEFRFLNDSRHYAGENLIVIAPQKELPKPRTTLAPWFRRVEILPPIILRRGGIPAITLAVARGLDFRPKS